MREKLIEVRGDKSQSDVAEVLGISQKTLSAIERGYRNPSVELMKKLQDYYKVSMIDLFNDIFKF
ncbi:MULTISPECIES: helix-turn-helix transcriptional regulator [Clostridium]|uniref:helix-turn-helix transcriptional regulator n=1 Tax=Clostridium sp. TaxID=1506 RepID=UPI001D1CD1B5|nr:MULTISPECIES: helix-turn-helix transcriptional regulator [Clostridium]MBS5986465.1 helix-turn-helix transcriptional regulator [Clostridium sp.]DAU88744.1 MAG TPA: helix-turn-helix domain protein [Caudoviricetes sp.]